MNAVAEAYGYKYDDRKINDRFRPALMDLAREYKISMVKLRKILITKGMFSTEVTREAIRLRSQGRSIDEIASIMDLGPAAVKAALPYEKCVYKTGFRSAAGDRVDKGRKRKRAVKRLEEVLAGYEGEYCDERGKLNQECSDALWECIVQYADYPFKTIGRGGKNVVSFKYKLKESQRTGNVTNELMINRKEHSKTITRSTVELAFVSALQVQATEGYVKGTRKLPCFGRSYLYAIFLTWGFISNIPKESLQ